MEKKAIAFFWVAFFCAIFHLPQEKEKLVTAIVGSSEYCTRLKEAPFKFSCREEISLARDNIIFRKGKNTVTGGQQFVFNYMPERQKFNFHYLFDYQLVNKNGSFREERKLVRAEGGDINQDPLDHLLFFAERVAYAPITIFEKNRVKEFNFGRVPGERKKGDDLFWIRAVPIDPDKWIFTSVDIGVDHGTHAVRKLKAFLHNFKGYKVLKRISAYYKSRLEVSCQVEFNENFYGLYFPTRVTIREHHRGGPKIPLYVGPKGWDRTLTTFTYSGYKFLYSGE